MCDLPRVPLRNKKVSWETLLTGKVVISEEGRLTIATTTTFRNQAGQVVREEEHILPRATLWVGGLHAFLQHAIRLSFFKREVSEANFKLFALAFQTIYDAAAKRPSNSPTEKRPFKSSERSPALNLAEFLLQQDVGLWTAATHDTTSESCYQTTLATVAVRSLRSMMPFSFRFMTQSGHRPVSVGGTAYR